MEKANQDNIGNQRTTKKIIVYLILVLGFVFGCGIIAAILPKETGEKVYRFSAAFFTAVPVLGALITRRLTGDKDSFHVNLRIWENPKVWIFSALAPGIAIFLGILFFYIMFPADLDVGATGLKEFAGNYGIIIGKQFTIASILRFGFITILLAAIFIPLQLLELGEEIGWRGYLLPLMCKKMSVRKAVLLNGVLWGIAHAPLIYFGFNYGTSYIGAPWTGILMMILVGVVVGIWTSYVMIKTNNCMYSAIIHGVVNVIGETGVFFSHATQSTLLGPNPTGVIGMSVLVLGAFILLMKLGNTVVE